MRLFGRVVYWLGWPLYRVMLNGKTRTRCIVRSGNEIILVRSSIGGQRWSLPGGGVKRNELFISAIKREVYEETGIKLEQVEQVGEVMKNKDGISQIMAIFAADSPARELKPRTGEIFDIGWFQVDKLPTPLSPTVTKALKLTDEN